MRTSMLAFAAMAIASVAAPALAQDAPASPFTVTGGATLTQDYRFRGISQTARDFAVQGTFTVAHESGFYATVWGSSIDDYVANSGLATGGSDQEIDFVGGWAKDFSGTKLDLGVLYYYYPGSGGGDTDFFEPYVAVSHTFGPVGAKVSAIYAPKQNALNYGFGKEDNFYLAADFSATIPDTPIGLTAHVGHNFERSFITFGEKYTDWSVGATYTWNHVTVGVSYVDADKNFYAVGSDQKTHNLTEGAVLGSIGVAF